MFINRKNNLSHLQKKFKVQSNDFIKRVRVDKFYVLLDKFKYLSLKNFEIIYQKFSIFSYCTCIKKLNQKSIYKSNKKSN